MLKNRHPQHQEPPMQHPEMQEDRRPARPVHRRPHRKRYGFFHWFFFWVGVVSTVYWAIRGVVYLFVIFG